MFYKQYPLPKDSAREDSVTRVRTFWMFLVGNAPPLFSVLKLEFPGPDGLVMRPQKL